MEATKKRTRNVPIPEDLHRKLKAEAYACGLTLAEHVEGYIRETIRLRGLDVGAGQAANQREASDGQAA